MTIKHLVISGGGPLGFRYLGALQHLEENNYWHINNIESIYATSAGTIIAVLMCLKFDWNTLNKYMIERPWKDAFKVSVKQIWNAYANKGLFDTQICEIVFKPLLKAKDLNLNITLKEFYEFSKIDLHFFSFDVNKFETVDLNHTVYPDMLLVQALTMSSALPGIFMPTFLDNKCLIDGGVMCNYPINECLRDHPLEDEILGVKIQYIYDNNDTNTNNSDALHLNSYERVSEESTLLEYTINLTINAMNYIRDSIKLQTIKNTLNIQIDKNPLGLDAIKEIIDSVELRKDFYEKGKQDAIDFLNNL